MHHLNLPAIIFCKPVKIIFIIDEGVICTEFHDFLMTSCLLHTEIPKVYQLVLTTFDRRPSRDIGICSSIFHITSCLKYISKLEMSAGESFFYIYLQTTVVQCSFDECLLSILKPYITIDWQQFKLQHTSITYRIPPTFSRTLLFNILDFEMMKGSGIAWFCSAEPRTSIQIKEIAASCFSVPM